MSKACFNVEGFGQFRNALGSGHHLQLKLDRLATPCSTEHSQQSVSKRVAKVCATTVCHMVS